MKFAHIRISEYFTFAERIFHREAISLAAGQISLKKAPVRTSTSSGVSDGILNPSRRVYSLLFFILLRRPFNNFALRNYSGFGSVTLAQKKDR